MPVLLLLTYQRFDLLHAFLLRHARGISTLVELGGQLYEPLGFDEHHLMYTSKGVLVLMAHASPH